jgi:hypothetical protein
MPARGDFIGGWMKTVLHWFVNDTNMSVSMCETHLDDLTYTKRLHSKNTVSECKPSKVGPLRNLAHISKIKALLKLLQTPTARQQGMNFAIFGLLEGDHLSPPWAALTADKFYVYYFRCRSYLAVSFWWLLDIPLFLTTFTIFSLDIIWYSRKFWLYKKASWHAQIVFDRVVPQAAHTFASRDNLKMASSGVEGLRGSWDYVCIRNFFTFHSTNKFVDGDQL